LTHPRYGHKKLYEVVVAGKISDADLKKWRDGVYLDGRKTARVKIKVAERSEDNSKLLITMREGRKRQIRKIAASLGYSVDRLIRLQIGPIQLSGLKPGQWKYLSEAEIQMLKESAYGESGIPG
jgi:pseudouridine synthase